MCMAMIGAQKSRSTFHSCPWI